MRRLHLLTLGLLLAAVTVTDAASAAKKTKKKKGPTPTVAAAVPDQPSQVAEEFDRAAASTALASVDLGKCKATNAKRGEGHVMVTFMANGTASAVTVDKGPMVGTPTAKCIAKEYAKARVPAFKNGPIQVGKTFKFE